MRKRSLVSLVLAALLVLTALPALSAEAPSAFTVMVYLCGTDLETGDGSASDDLIEMMLAEIPAGGPVNVLIETGGTKEWWIDDINPSLNERWLLDDGDILRKESMPRRDMADADTLFDFIQWSVSEYPAERYGLVLWNHGGGSTGGVCYDEFSGDFLTALDLHEVLSAVQADDEDFFLDFVAFDACLMATFEMANYLADYADYMFASEEVVSGYGLDYTAFLSAIGKNPGIETEALGRVVADSYIDTTLSYDPDDYLTFSVLDLREVRALTDAMEDIGSGLQIALDTGGLSGISRGRQMMRSQGDFYTDGSDMVDMRLFIERFADVSGADASAALRSLDRVVAYSAYTRDKLDDICGLSILVPLKTREDFTAYSVYYDPLELFPAYTAFLTEYTDALNTGSYVFSASTPEVVTGTAVLSSALHALMESGGQMDASESAPATEEETEDGYEEPGQDMAAETLAYTVTLPADDLEYLAYVEGNLMLDISDDEIEAYVDLGYLQNNEIDWESGVVTSEFDGTWPTLDGQLVYMVDQLFTRDTRRSLIDVRVNDLDVYLLVVFDAARPMGEVVGYTEGYSEQGIPVRGYEKLKPGDVITPQYYIYYYDEDGEEQIEPLLGDPIVYTGESLTFAYESLVGSGENFAYTFCLNDVFGDYAFTDFIYFTL